MKKNNKSKSTSVFFSVSRKSLSEELYPTKMTFEFKAKPPFVSQKGSQLKKKSSYFLAATVLI